MPVEVKEEEPSEQKFLEVVEEAAEFRAVCLLVYSSCIRIDIKYPTITQENGTQGQVVLQFVVERDGSITDIKVVRALTLS